MGDQKIEALELSLYEDAIEELEKKYFGGITAGGPDKGCPWYHKSDQEIEDEATKKVQEFMDRNS